MSEKRPLYRHMLIVVGDCVRRCMGKAVFAIFVYNIIQSFLFSISLFPVMIPFLDSRAPSFSAQCASCVLLFASLVADSMLTFGIFSMMGRMAERSFVTLGFLFYGFKPPRRNKVLLLSVVITLVQVVVGVAVTLVLTFSPIDIASLVETKGLEKVLEALVPCCLALFVVVLVPLSLSFVILYLEPELSVWSVIKKSVSLVIKNLFHYVGFLLAGMGTSLLLLVAVSVIVAFLPEGNATGVVGLLSLFLSFASFMLQLVVLVRLYFAIPVYYFSLSGHFRYSGGEVKKQPAVLSFTGSAADKPAGADAADVDAAPSAEIGSDSADDSDMVDESDSAVSAENASFAFASENADESSGDSV